jgi:hypothetical protein
MRRLSGGAPVRVAAAGLSWISAASFASPIRWRQRVSDERSKGVTSASKISNSQAFKSCARRGACRTPI